MAETESPVVEYANEIFINPEQSAVDEDGNVVLAITKFWPSLDVSLGSSKFRGGYSAMPRGLLPVKFPIRVENPDGSPQLTFKEFETLLEFMNLVMEKSVRAFTKITFDALKPPEEQF